MWAIRLEAEVKILAKNWQKRIIMEFKLVKSWKEKLSHKFTPMTSLGWSTCIGTFLFIYNQYQTLAPTTGKGS